ncbi:MAG TPA: ROK family protein, partial [Micromonosporaceae bacterium]
MTLTIGVDVGGTKVLAGVVDPAGMVLAETRRHTPAEDVSGTLATIIEVIRELAAGTDIEAVG